MDSLLELRQNALEQCQVLDTPREASFDRLVFTAAQLFGVSMATISFITAERVWSKARVGWFLPEVERAQSFCAHVIGTDRPIVAEDTSRDRRFARLPTVVGPPGIRFFAGTPLLGPDQVPVGALCIFDTRPRSMSESERRHLGQLGREVSELLLLRVKEPEQQF